MWKTAELKLHGTEDSGAGAALNLDGDYDGDGRGDAVVAGLGGVYDNRGGEVWIAASPGAGDFKLTDVAFAHIDGNFYGSFGMEVARAGDLDGDGWDDLVVAGYGSMVSLYYGPIQGELLQDRPNAWIANYVTALAPLGDVDGDGFDDLAIGDYAYSEEMWNQGAVYLLYGGVE